jgi:hypothetical protein
MITRYSILANYWQYGFYITYTPYGSIMFSSNQAPTPENQPAAPGDEKAQSNSPGIQDLRTRDFPQCLVQTIK